MSEANSPQDESPKPQGLEAQVIDILKTCYDPEIPVDIYQLGMIYTITIEAENHVVIEMTLTSPACPAIGTLPGEVEDKVKSLDDVSQAKVNLVWEPPWNPDMMSEAAKLELGMM